MSETGHLPVYIGNLSQFDDGVIPRQLSLMSRTSLMQAVTQLMDSIKLFYDT